MVGTTTETSPARAGSTSARWPERVLVGAMLLSTALVLFRLGDRSLWYDEGFTVGTVDRPFGDALWRIANWELNQSPFLLLFAGWHRLGDGETFLRLLPGAFTVLSVPAVFALGRRVAGPPVAAVAAMLLAVHPLSLQWGQQLRGYSLAMLLSILATTLLLRAVDRPTDRRSVIAYALVAAVATYAHFFAGFVVLAHALWLVFRRPLPRRTALVAGVVYLMAIAPLAEYFLTRRGDPLSWVRRDAVGSIARDTSYGLSGGTATSAIAYGVALAVGCAVAIRLRGDTTARPLAALIALCAFVPPVIVTITTVTVKPLLETRFLIVVVPAAIVLVAIGVVGSPRPVGVVVFLAVMAVSVVGLDQWYTGTAFEDWRAAAKTTADLDEGADLVFDPWGGRFSYQFYEDLAGLEPRTVVRPGPDVPAATDVVIEIRRDGDEGPGVDPTLIEWYDRHGYEVREIRRVDGLTIRVLRRG